MNQNIQKAYALLIGASEHPQSMRSRPDVTEEVNIIKSGMEASVPGLDPENLKVLLGEEATRPKILEELDWLARELKENPEAKGLLYFMGFLKTTSDEVCIIAYDTDDDQPLETGIAASLIAQKIEGIDSDRLMLQFPPDLDDAVSGEGFRISGALKDRLPKQVKEEERSEEEKDDPDSINIVVRNDNDIVGTGGSGAFKDHIEGDFVIGGDTSNDDDDNDVEGGVTSSGAFKDHLK